MEGSTQKRLHLDIEGGTLVMASKTRSKMANACSNITRASIRGKTVVTQESNLSSAVATLFPVKGIPGSQAVRQKQVNYRPLKSEQVYRKQIIQNDKPHSAEKTHNNSSMGINNRHPGCLSTCTGKKMLTQVSCVHGCRKAIFLQSPTVRLVHSPKSVHSHIKMASHVFTPEGNKCIGLHRRLGCMVGDNRSEYRANSDSNKVSSKTRLPNQLGQICPCSLGGNSMARGEVELEEGHVGSHVRYSCENTRTDSRDLESEKLYKKRVGENDGLPSICLPNSSAPKEIVSPSSQATTIRRGSRERLKKGGPEHVAEFAKTMDAGRTSLGSGSASAEPTNNLLVDRRIELRMGSSDFGEQDSSRKMVPTGGVLTHKCVRAVSCKKGTPDTGEASDTHTDIHGQYSGTTRNQQDGVKEGIFTRSSVRDLQDSGSIKQCNSRLADPKLSKCGGGRSVKESASSHRMGGSSRGVQEVSTMEGSVRDRPIRNAIEHETSSVRNAISPSSRLGGRCIGSRLEQMESSIPVSTEEFANQSSRETESLLPSRNVNSALETNEAMVSIPHTEGQVNTASVYGRRSMGPGKVRRIRVSLLRKLDRLQFLKRVFKQKFGCKVASVLSAAYRESTNRQAQSAWKAFQGWLPRSVNSISKKTILAFLISKFGFRKVSPRTILGYKNALALPMLYGFGVDVTDKEFSLLSRALFLKYPPQTKIFPTWSLNKVLEYFSAEAFHNKWGSLRNLLIKTVFLVALASGNRVSELSALSRTGIIFEENYVKILVKEGFLYKNQSARRTPPPISLPKLESHPHPLCPVFALKTYLDRTKDLEHKAQVFLSPVTNVPLKAGRLAYWLCKGIKQADPNSFVRAHDVRKQAFSLAWTRGMSLKCITERGFWLSPNTFINKYLSTVEAPRARCVAGSSI